MRSFNFLFKLSLAAGACLIVAGLGYLHSHKGNGQLGEAWDFRPSLYEQTGARIESKGRSLDLSDRDLVLSRSALEAQIAAAEKAADKKAAAKAKPEVKKKKAKNKDKKVAKKKRKRKAKPEASDDEQMDSGERDEDFPESVAAAPPAPAAAFGGQAITEDEQIWRQRLLRGPDAKALREFIEAYSNEKVTAEVFYSILEEMLADSRSSMNSLALEALDSTPSNESFSLLAIYKGKVETRLQSSFEQAIDRYRATIYLTVLEKALSSEESIVTHQALSILELAAQDLLAEARSQAVDQPRLLRGFSSIEEVESYRPLIPALTHLTESSDAGLAEAARGVLDQLERMQATSLG